MHHSRRHRFKATKDIPMFSPASREGQGVLNDSRFITTSIFFYRQEHRVIEIKFVDGSPGLRFTDPSRLEIKSGKIRFRDFAI